MNQRHYLLKGTFLLTATGLLTRLAGFFYKIFLSRTIGAREIGLFQLTLPIYSFCMAFACGGIQTAISRFTAEDYARGDRASARRTLVCGLFLSGTLATVCACTVYQNAAWLASRFLLEPACTKLLQIAACSLPFCVIHSCLGGYFIGQKKIFPSAASQFLEQLLRICSAFFFYASCAQSGRNMDATVMALGQLAGEMASALYCLGYLFWKHDSHSHTRPSSGISTAATPKAPVPPSSVSTAQNNCLAISILQTIKHTLKKTVSVSAPLGLNRMLLCILQGIEASLLPQQLQRFGLDSHDALSFYGILTGMSLPLILFPTAITGALGTLLLPAVSEANALSQDKKISGTINASFQGSLLLGSFCLTGFLLFGKAAGTLLFENELAGIYIQKLALLCPFLYLNTTMVSILHGLGKSTAVFLWNITSFGVRLAAVLWLVPIYGMDGYLCGILFAQLFITICTMLLLFFSKKLTVSITDTLLKILGLGIGSGTIISVFRQLIPKINAAINTGMRADSWPVLLGSCLLYAFSFSLPAFYLFVNGKKRSVLFSRLKQKFIKIQ